MISVIIPTYNRSFCLDRALSSVFKQTRPCDEIIVVDDGSTDNTQELLSRMATPKLRCIRQENQGAAAARNAGIQEARGSLLAFLDSDDWWLPKKLVLQAAHMEQYPQFLISHTQELWFRHGKRLNQKKKHAPPHGDIFLRSLRMCVVGMSTVMARRELFQRFGLFDPALICCEDYDLWLRVGCQEPFLLLPQALTGKEGGRADQLSVIHRLGMDRRRIRSLAALIGSGVLTLSQTDDARQELIRKCLIYAQGCVKHGRAEEAAPYFTLAAKAQQRKELVRS